MTTTELYKRRSDFEGKVFAYANDHCFSIPKLFYAEELGFCLLEWRHLRWECRWFDKAEQLPVTGESYNPEKQLNKDDDKLIALANFDSFIEECEELAENLEKADPFDAPGDAMRVRHLIQTAKLYRTQTK